MEKTLSPRLWLCTAFLFCFSFSLSLSAQEINHPNAERDVQMLQDLRKAYMNGDWDKWQSHFTSNAMAYNVIGMDSITVTELVAAWKADRGNYTKTQLGEGPVLPMSIAEGPFKGDWLFEWNTYLAVTKDGKNVSFLYHLVMKLNNGKVESATWYYNEASIQKQLGFTVTPPKN